MRTTTAIAALCLLAATASAFNFGFKSKNEELKSGTVEQSGARDVWMKGYLKMQEAGRAENEQNRVLALNLYSEAVDVFERVKSEHPGWNPDLVEYRLTFCRSRIRNIEGLVEADQSEMSKVELKGLVDELQAEIEPLKEELDSVTKKRNQLTENVEAMQAKLDSLDDAQSKIANLRARVDQLETRNSELTTTLEQVRKERDSLRSSLRNASESQDEKIEKLQNTITSLEKKNARMQNVESNEDLRASFGKQLQTKEARIAELQERLEAMEETAGKTAAPADASAGKQTDADLKACLAEARAAERQGDMQTAVTAYRKALETASDNQEVRLRLGTLLVDQDKNAEAEAVLAEAYRAEPENTAYYVPYGISLLRQEKLDRALALFATGVALAPKNADLHAYMGVAARALGWTEAAEGAFLRAFKLDDTRGETAYNLALHYMTLETPQVEKAKKWYDKAVDLGQPHDEELEQALDAFMKGE